VAAIGGLTHCTDGELSLLADVIDTYDKEPVRRLSAGNDPGQRDCSRVCLDGPSRRPDAVVYPLTVR
jgi:hypothetical protein